MINNQPDNNTARLKNMKYLLALVLAMAVSSNVDAARPDYFCSTFTTKQMVLVDTQHVRIYKNDVVEVRIDKTTGLSNYGQCVGVL